LTDSKLPFNTNVISDSKDIQDSYNTNYHDFGDENLPLQEPITTWALGDNKDHIPKSGLIVDHVPSEPNNDKVETHAEEVKRNIEGNDIYSPKSLRLNTDHLNITKSEHSAESDYQINSDNLLYIKDHHNSEADTSPIMFGQASAQSENSWKSLGIHITPLMNLEGFIEYHDPIVDASVSPETIDINSVRKTISTMKSVPLNVEFSIGDGLSDEHDFKNRQNADESELTYAGHSVQSEATITEHGDSIGDSLTLDYGQSSMQSESSTNYGQSSMQSESSTWKSLGFQSTPFIKDFSEYGGLIIGPETEDDKSVNFASSEEKLKSKGIDTELQKTIESSLLANSEDSIGDGLSDEHDFKNRQNADESELTYAGHSVQSEATITEHDDSIGDSLTLAHGEIGAIYEDYVLLSESINDIERNYGESTYTFVQAPVLKK
jgi:hypothetical protein